MDSHCNCHKCKSHNKKNKRAFHTNKINKRAFHPIDPIVPIPTAPISPIPTAPISPIPMTPISPITMAPISPIPMATISPIALSTINSCSETAVYVSNIKSNITVTNFNFAPNNFNTVHNTPGGGSRCDIVCGDICWQGSGWISPTQREPPDSPNKTLYILNVFIRLSSSVTNTLTVTANGVPIISSTVMSASNSIQTSYVSSDPILFIFSYSAILSRTINYGYYSIQGK